MDMHGANERDAFHHSTTTPADVRRSHRQWLAVLTGMHSIKRATVSVTMRLLTVTARGLSTLGGCLITTIIESALQGIYPNQIVGESVSLGSKLYLTMNHNDLARTD